MIHVSVVAPGPDRKNFRLRWKDPDTGKDCWRSSKTTSESKAQRAAQTLEEQLNTGEYAGLCAIRWDAFRKRFEDEALAAMAENSRQAYKTVLNHVAAIINPAKLTGITQATLARFVAKLRSDKKSENSIKSYLGHVQGFLSWAKKMGLIGRVLEMPKLHRAQKAAVRPMRGRPITDKEFAAMLAAVPKVVGERSAASWKYWLEGLWWSGLRLAESLDLYWDQPEHLCLDLTGEHPMLRIRYTMEKGKRDRLLPLAPEFCEFLLKTPEDRRHGPVFRLSRVNAPEAKGGRPRNMPAEVDEEWAGRICSRIGQKAKIVVDTTDNGRIKYASAHDLRRAFGNRWARRVTTVVLMQLMRHRDIKTTMRYYVDLDARETAAQVWAAVQPSGGRKADCSVSCSADKKNPKGRKTRRNVTKGSETT